MAYDISRDIVLNEFKIEVLRFTDKEIKSEINNVIEKIKAKIEILRLRFAQKPGEETIAR